MMAFLIIIPFCRPIYSYYTILLRVLICQEKKYFFVKKGDIRDLILLTDSQTFYYWILYVCIGLLFCFPVNALSNKLSLNFL